MVGTMFTARERPIKATRRAANPIIRQTFTMFEPITFPIEIALSPVNAAMTATQNSGKDVEKAIRIKPMVIFPSPVISDVLIALVIVMWLALLNISKKMSRMMTLINSAISTLRHHRDYEDGQ